MIEALEWYGDKHAKSPINAGARKLNRDSERQGYVRPAMSDVGFVGPVPEQISKEMQEFCVQNYVEGRMVNLLGLHGLGLF